MLLRYYHNAVVITYYVVARAHGLACTTDLGIDLTKTFRFTGIRYHSPGKYRKFQFPDIINIPDCPIYNYSGHSFVEAT